MSLCNLMNYGLWQLPGYREEVQNYVTEIPLGENLEERKKKED